MSPYHLISLIGAIASILGLILYILEKQNTVSYKLSLRNLLVIIIITILFFAIGQNKVHTEIGIDGDNNHQNEIHINK